MRTNPILIIVALALISSTFAVPAFCQSELVGRDTSVILITRSGFQSPLSSADHEGYSMTVAIGLFGRLNIGLSETDWTRYSVSAKFPRPWLDEDLVPGEPHRSQSGYIEYLPLHKFTRRVSASVGLGFVAGSDAGAGQGAYHGFTFSGYGTVHVLRFLDVRGTFIQALIANSGNNGVFTQTSYGGGVGLKIVPNLLLTGSALESRTLERKTITTSIGLALLVPR